jgi:large subunit ribosomal protein L24
MLSRLKRDDLVMVISGKEKGKQGRIVAIDKVSDRVKITGVALVTRHVKARSAKEKSKIVREESFIAACKVMPICPSTQKPCRVRTKQLPDGKRVRISHRSQEQI